MRFLNKNIQKFYNDVVLLCKKHNIKLKLVNDRRILVDGKHTNGVFYVYNSKGILSVAIGKTQKEWLPILVHEYCHLLQYLENATVWKKIMNTNSIEIVDKHIDGDNINKDIVDKSYKIIQDLEHDCEKRAIEIIKKYKLPIDLSVYIQKANSYILFYSYSFKKKVWYNKKKAPYEIEEIVSEMPKRLLKNYYSLKPKIYKLYENHYNTI